MNNNTFWILAKIEITQLPVNICFVFFSLNYSTMYNTNIYTKKKWKYKYRNNRIVHYVYFFEYGFYYLYSYTNGRTLNFKILLWINETCIKSTFALLEHWEGRFFIDYNFTDSNLEVISGVSFMEEFQLTMLRGKVYHIVFHIKKHKKKKKFI